MQTIQIIREAFGTLLAHPWTALRTTAGPLLLLAVLWDVSVSISNGTLSALLNIYSFVAVLCFFWAIVAWHRAFLLGERPGLLPKFHLKRILHYIRCSMTIGIPGGLCALPFVLPVLALLASVVDFATLDASGLISIQELGLTTSQIVFLAAMMFLGSFVGVYVFLRLSPVLPAAAIDRPVTRGDAWASTRAGRGSIALLAVGYAAVTLFLLLDLQGAIILPLQIIVALIGMILVWIFLVLHASFITTIYRCVVVEADGAT